MRHVHDGAEAIADRLVRSIASYKRGENGTRSALEAVADTPLRPLAELLATPNKTQELLTGPAPSGTGILRAMEADGHG